MEMHLTEAERIELLKLVEEALAEKRVEIRHTRNHDWKDALHDEELLLAALLERLKDFVVA